MPRGSSARARRHLALLVGVAWVALHYWIFSAFFPTRAGMLGFDYGYFLPHLLDGEYWRIANGVFSIPWFTPAFCGGIPKFANPQSLYFSAPQLFVSLADPVVALRLTLLVFAGLGHWGFYLFQRRLFGISRPIAMLGAALFLFNTHFSSRMLIGHLTFHSFMLVPFVPLWLFGRGGDSARARCLEIAGVACVLAYLASASIAHVLFQGLLITAIAGLLQMAIAPDRCRPGRALVRAGAAAPLAVALCAAQLVAMEAFLGGFPRSQYPLASVASVPDLARLVFRVLFFDPPSQEAIDALLTNALWTFARHEFEFGVSVVPLALIAIAAVCRKAERSPLLPSGLWRGYRGASLAGAVFLLVIPLALNFYQPAWHAWLKSLPLFASSSTLLRWLSVYVPIAILAGSVAAESSAALRRRRWWVLAIGSGALVANLWRTDRGFYEQQSYDPAPIVAAFSDARRPGFAPAIHANEYPRAFDGPAPVRNNVLVHGASQIACYETLFGFQFEKLPKGLLREAPVLELQSGAFNLLDPACFLFPSENGCMPGEPFFADRRADVEAFTSYRPFPFAMPRSQRIANAVNVVALIGVGAGLALHALDRMLRWAVRAVR